MKKENKDLKREAEQKELDKQFTKRGNICLIIIVATVVVMLIVGKQCQGQVWLPYFFGVGVFVIAGAFLYSLRQVTKRIKNGAGE